MKIVLTGEDLALLKEAYKYKDVIYIDEGLGLHLIEPSFIYRIIDPMASKDYKSFQNTVVAIMTRYCNNCSLSKEEIEKIYDNFLNKKGTKIKAKSNNSNKIEDKVVLYRTGSSFVEYMLGIQESMCRYSESMLLLEAK